MPPWYASEDELYKTAKVIEQTAKEFSAFFLRFEKILFGPPGQPPRLIWAEGTMPTELVKLKEAAENSLLAGKTGFLKKENRPPKLHLTIARFEPISIKKLPQLNEATDLRFDVNEIVLMKSELKRTGAEYLTLKAFSFLQS